MAPQLEFVESSLHEQGHFRIVLAACVASIALLFAAMHVWNSVPNIEANNLLIRKKVKLQLSQIEVCINPPPAPGLRLLLLAALTGYLKSPNFRHLSCTFGVICV